MKDLASALRALFSDDDYARRTASTRAAVESMGEYQGILKDKENICGDWRKIRSDINVAIKSYGPITAQ